MQCHCFIVCVCIQTHKPSQTIPFSAAAAAAAVVVDSPVFEFYILPRPLFLVLNSVFESCVFYFVYIGGIQTSVRHRNWNRKKWIGRLVGSRFSTFGKQLYRFRPFDAAQIFIYNTKCIAHLISKIVVHIGFCMLKICKLQIFDKKPMSVFDFAKMEPMHTLWYKINWKLYLIASFHWNGFSFFWFNSGNSKLNPSLHLNTYGMVGLASPQ